MKASVEFSLQRRISVWLPVSASLRSVTVGLSSIGDLDSIFNQSFLISVASELSISPGFSLIVFSVTVFDRVNISVNESGHASPFFVPNFL